MKSRSAEKEKLDDLFLSGETLHKALQSLAWINKWFGNHRAIIKGILAVHNKDNRTLRITDLGCGGGDMVLEVARTLQKRNILDRIFSPQNFSLGMALFFALYFPAGNWAVQKIYAAVFKKKLTS